MGSVVRTALKILGGILSTLALLVAASYLHTKVFPLSLESYARQIAYRHAFLRPVVVDGWGTLMTRILPLDAQHLAVGLSTSIGTLKQNGTSIELCAKIEGIGIVHDLVVQNNILYAASGAENLAWYDVSAPCSPRKLGSYLFGGYGFGIQIVDDRLFLANRHGGVVVFRLSENGTPKFERVRFGDLHASDEEKTPWMTSDVTLVGKTLVAADGNQGILMFSPEGETDQGIRPFFSRELTDSGAERNIDPAPLRVRSHRHHLYAAMREKGVAVVSLPTSGDPRLVAMVRPDDAEVLDLLVDGDTLYVPSTRGTIHAFDLAADPQGLSQTKAVYAIGEERSLHSLGFRAPYLYASSIGVGLVRFAQGMTGPDAGWRPPDEFRSLARVGDRFVAALGSGGVAVYEPANGVWQQTATRSMPSFAFEVLSLGENRFAASGDVAGTQVYSIGPDGGLTRLFTIPTPEHSFSTAFLPPDQVATANGVFGVLRYRIDLENRAYENLQGEKARGFQGYSMHVDQWKGQFVGANFSGPVDVTDHADGPLFDTRPSRCFKGATSVDREEFAISCKGDQVFHYSDDRTLTVIDHPRDVASVLPAPPYVLVGGFPDRVTVYRKEGAAFDVEADLPTPGVPYQMLQDGDRFLIAAGRAGVLELSRQDGRWQLRSIPMQSRPPRSEWKPTPHS